MHRMTLRNNSNLFAIVALTLSVTLGTVTANGQSPLVRQASIDYEASGYVTPAGMVHPSFYQGGVMPVGYAMACDSGCDGGCDGCGGLLGKMTSGCGCGACGGGMASTRLWCIFCQGSGCGVCQMLTPASIGSIGGCLCKLLPYSDAGLCAQRWYDASAEVVFLSHSNGSLQGPLTSLGAAGPTVLSLGDADSGSDLEAGMRFSIAMIWGPGGNLEATYMGNNQWNSRAGVTDPGGNLFSVISDFGTNPIGGFADTDNQVAQQVAVDSEFHSGELNYRRRVMGPYCRFQGSWLVGMRYLRFDNGLIYSGTGAGGQFSSQDRLVNDLFGGQIGGDVWWNIRPGVNLGVGLKGAWVQNDIDRTTRLQANGVPVDVSFADTERDGTVLGELEATLIYRLSHSWSFRSSYYAIAVDDIGFAIADRDTIRNFVAVGPATPPRYNLHSLVVQGVGFGAEYIW
jgi:hypothetical protein